MGSMDARQRRRGGAAGGNSDFAGGDPALFTQMLPLFTRWQSDKVPHTGIGWTVAKVGSNSPCAGPIWRGWKSWPLRAQWLDKAA